MKKFLLFIFGLASILLSAQSNAQCTLMAITDTTVCSGRIFRMQALGAGYTTYQWTTSGTGTFDYTENNGLTADYKPSAADIAAGTINLSITASGNCSTKTIISKVRFHNAPTFSINAGADQTSCGTVTLNATAINAKIFTWVSLGSGTLANASAFSTTYTPSFDDKLKDSVKLWAIINGSDSICGFANDTDEVVIRYLPSNAVFLGSDLVSCQTSAISLTNATLANTSGILWSTSGTGTFSDATALHPTYQPSSADISAGSVQLRAATTGNTNTCPIGRDTLVVTFNSSNPMVNAGSDQTVCGNMAHLNATYSGTNGVIWSTSGTGHFSADSTLSSSTVEVYYSPSYADFLSPVTLTATSLSNILCPSATDELIVTFSPKANLSIIIGDSAICQNGVAMPMAYVSTGSITWTTSGSGTFDNAAYLSPVYTPSAADYTAGQFILTVTSAINGSCPSEANNVTFTIRGSVSTANAGADQVNCGNTVELNGQVTNADTGVWTSSGTGVFVPSAYYVNTSYILSSDDVAHSPITLTLTTMGACGAEVSDEMTVTVINASIPVVHAGPDQVVSSTSTVALNGTVSGSSNVLWTTSGSGTFSNATSAATTYTPSTLDIASGLVQLRLTANSSSGCPAGQDDLFIKLGTQFTITGTIKANTNTLDFGYVALYKKESSGLYFVDSDSIFPSDAGTYIFDTLPGGTYIILATPAGNSIYQNTFLPTYWGGTQEWSNAGEITVTGVGSYNIYLTAYTSADPDWNTGKDTIAGTVYVNQSSATARIQSTLTPAAYATVYLTDASGNKIAYTQTDANGRYKFVNVQAGKYAVNPNYAGTGLSGTTSSVPVTVDGNPATIEDGSMTLEQKAFTTTGVFNAVKSAVLTAYPNPAKNSVTVNLTTSAGNGIVKLMNENGTVVLQQQMDLSGSSITLNIESLSAGMYILQLVAEDQVYTSKVIKY